MRSPCRSEAIHSHDLGGSAPTSRPTSQSSSGGSTRYSGDGIEGRTPVMIAIAPVAIESGVQ